MKTLLIVGAGLCATSLAAIAQKDTTILVQVTVPVTYTIPAPQIIYVTQPTVPAVIKAIDTSYAGSGTLFNVPQGMSLYEGYNVTMGTLGIAFSPSQSVGATYDVALRNVKVKGGSTAFWSTQHGTVTGKNNIRFDSVEFRTNLGCVAIYSPSGPFVNLYVNNSKFYPKQSHGLYVGNNVNVSMSNVYVDSMGSGINSDVALSLSHRSTNVLPGSGKTINKYFKCVGGPKAGAWQFSGQSWLDSCDLTLYSIAPTDPPGFIHASNSILNCANNGFFRGDGYNCTGKSIIFKDTANVVGFKYKTVAIGDGNFVFRNCEFDEVFGVCSPDPDACSPFTATFINCKINVGVANIPKGSVFIVYGRETPYPKQWNSPYQPTYIFN